MDDSNQKHPPPSSPASPCAIESVHGDGSSDDPICLDAVGAASRETATNDDMDYQYIPQGEFRTDVKRKQKYSESRKKLLCDFEVWLDTVKKYPYIWLEDDVSFLREFVSTVNNDREHFPPALPPGGPTNKGALKGSPVREPTPPLDRDFVSRIYLREMLSDLDCHPIGLVTACSSKFHEIHHSSLNKVDQRKIHTLHLADGNEIIVTVKVASQLNSVMHLVVTVGSVLKLLRYHTVPFRQSTSQDAQLRIAVILLNFDC
jgi:hypothetical protein